MLPSRGLSLTAKAKLVVEMSITDRKSESGIAIFFKLDIERERAKMGLFWGDTLELLS